MENERHVVVESPDGNVSIGMNQDIEAPQSADEPQLQQYPHLEIIVKYPEINRMVLWVFLWLGLYALSIRFSVADVLNIMFLVVTFYVLLFCITYSRHFYYVDRRSVSICVGNIYINNASSVYVRGTGANLKDGARTTTFGIRPRFRVIWVPVYPKITYPLNTRFHWSSAV